MNLKRLLALLTIFACAFAPVRAGEPGTTAMDFLNIGVSARTAGTGGAFSALADGPTASYYNPSGLAESDNIQIAGMHSEWFQDLHYEYLGLAVPAGSHGAFGVSMTYLGMGDINAFSSSNTAIGNVSAYDWSLGISYGRKLSSEISLGAGLKSVGEKLADINAHGMAGDIGLQYRARSFNAGLSIMNIGPNIKYASASSSLPTRIDAGLSYWLPGSNLQALVGMTMPLHGNLGFKTGLEYTYAEHLVLRGGYNTANRIDGQGGLSLGAGFNILLHSLDYAYNVNSVLGGTHQISFLLRFGQPRERSYSHKKLPHNPQEGGASESESENGQQGKANYLVCAGRCSDLENAQRHLEALQGFGLSPRLSKRGQGEYLVVLGKTGGWEEAEKMKRDFGKKGVSCFIEED